jgi:hypothetical protein
MKNNFISAIVIVSVFLVAAMISGIVSNAIAQQNATTGLQNATTGLQNATTGLQNATGIANTNNGGVSDPTLGTGAVGREGAEIGAMGSEETPSGNNAGSESEGTRGNTGGIGGGLGPGNGSSLGQGSGADTSGGGAGGY